MVKNRKKHGLFNAGLLALAIATSSVNAKEIEHYGEGQTMLSSFVPTTYTEELTQKVPEQLSLAHASLNNKEQSGSVTGSYSLRDKNNTQFNIGHHQYTQENANTTLGLTNDHMDFSLSHLHSETTHNPWTAEARFKLPNTTLLGHYDLNGGSYHNHLETRFGNNQLQLNHTETQTNAFWSYHQGNNSIGAGSTVSAQQPDIHLTAGTEKAFLWAHKAKKEQPEGILYLGNLDHATIKYALSSTDIRTPHQRYIGLTTANYIEQKTGAVAVKIEHNRQQPLHFEIGTRPHSAISLQGGVKLEKRDYATQRILGYLQTDINLLGLPIIGREMPKGMSTNITANINTTGNYGIGINTELSF